MRLPMLRNVFIVCLTAITLSSCSLFQKSVQKSNRQSITSTEDSAEIFDTQSSPELRKQILDLEKKLESKKEKEQYSKALPWFKSDKERYDYLSSPGLENKTQFLQQKRILQRQQIPTPEVRELIDNQDIAIGMPMDFVIKAWGEPVTKESSGNPLYKNEKWKYIRTISSSEGFRQEKRYVYFEGGRVVGWESE